MRYYDPAVGRFLNPDIYVNANGDITGFNMYAYCSNNPVMFTDFSGQGIIKSAVKWIVKNIGKPVVKTVQNVLSKINSTYSTGLSVSGTIGSVQITGQAGIAIDTKGNVDFHCSISYSWTSGSPSFSVARYETKTNAPSIKNLEGLGAQVGGSVAIPIPKVKGVNILAGYDVNIMPDRKNDKVYYGNTKSIGVSFGSPGGEAHIGFGYTKPDDRFGFNIFEVADEMYDYIMEG